MAAGETHTARSGRAERAGSRAVAGGSRSRQLGPRRIVARPHLAGVRLARLVVAEAALVAVALGALIAPALGAALALPALGVVAAALGRRRGRWLSADLSTWLAFRSRVSRGVAGTDRRFEAFGGLLAGVALREVVDRAGGPVGVLGDGESLAVLLELESPGIFGVVDGDAMARGFDVSDLAAAVAEPDQVVASVQVVTTTVAAPARRLSAAGDPLANSYSRLARRPGVGPVPALRRTWVVLRCEPRRCVGAVAARGGGTEGAHRAVIGAGARLGARLGTGGAVRLLDAWSVVEALHFAGDIDQPGPAGAAGAREQWTSWTAAGRLHACFAVRRWPAVGQPPALPALAGLPASSDTTAVTFGPAPGGDVAVGAMVRLTALDADELAAAADELVRRAGELGVGLERLDGDHAPGVLATLPLGGVGR